MFSRQEVALTHIEKWTVGDWQSIKHIQFLYCLKDDASLECLGHRYVIVKNSTRVLYKL
jgi:hypothetical protein